MDDNPPDQRGFGRPFLTLSGGGGTLDAGPLSFFNIGGNATAQIPLGANTLGLGATASYGRGTYQTPEGKIPVGNGLSLNGLNAFLQTPDGQRFAAEWARRLQRDPNGGPPTPDNQYWLRYNTRF